MTDKQSLHVVLYTDGSARPNPGFIGSGAHGYVVDTLNYTEEMPKTNPVYTHYGFVNYPDYLSFANKRKEKGNEHRHSKPLYLIDYIRPNKEISTNNNAEALALYHGIRMMMESEIADNIKSFNVFTDSEYVKKGVSEYLPSMIRRNWVNEDGTPIPNAETWKNISSMLKLLKEKDITINVYWLRGHNNDYGNTQADLLCAIAGNLSANGLYEEHFDLLDTKKHRKFQVEKHPFMNFKRLYFSPNNECNTRGQYFLSDPGVGDVYIGNRSPLTGFAVVHLQEPDEIVETIKSKHIEVAGDSNIIAMLNIEKAFDKETAYFINRFGKNALFKSSKNLNIEFADKQLISNELMPSRLSPRAVDALNTLEELLLAVDKENGKSTVFFDIQLHNITDKLYDLDDKSKQVLKKEYIVGFKNMFANVTRMDSDSKKEIQISIPLIMGLDMPSRNHMKRLEVFNPEVFVVTWSSSSHCVRYCVYIRCSNAVGVWSNFFSDRVFINLPVSNS